MPLTEIGKLTTYQINNILFREHDKEGYIKRDPDKVVCQSPEEQFRERWRRWGLHEDRITQKWHEFLAAIPRDEDGNAVTMRVG